MANSFQKRNDDVVRFPQWLKRPLSSSGKKSDIEKFVHCSGLHTVCIEAKCPNRGECYSKGTATFLIMGNVCTRNCNFCSVNHGSPAPLDPQEPFRVAEAVKNMGIRHVVVTSVTRDDLSDGGAAFFAQIISCIREDSPDVTVELLVPDFKGDPASIDKVISGKPDVFNHNIETVPSLYESIRPQAVYSRSLSVLNRASQAGLVTKSGIMVGLGETEDEVKMVMKDIFDAGCSILTIGQYLRPSRNQVPVKEFISPDQFENYRKAGIKTGFKYVFSGPFVRSSYKADEVSRKVLPKQG